MSNRVSSSKRNKQLRKYAREKTASVLKRQGNICAECGKPMRIEFIGTGISHGDRPTIDHIKPLSEGGSNRLENLELVHSHCNKTRDKRYRRWLAAKEQSA